MEIKELSEIKLFEMFAGYGGGSFALKKANIPFELVGYSEIDKFAIKCFEQNHKGNNYGDCKLINPNDLPDFNLLTGGFPCQDVSIAGNRNLSKGRTNLYKEIIRIAEVKKPKYMLLENVKGLLSMGKERKLVNIIVSDLQRIGYGVCWKVLNSKDYGIPQNRERVWFVCKYGGWKFGEFSFPNKEELKLKLGDILEDNVDKKYYLTEKTIKMFLKHRVRQIEKKNGFFFSPKTVDSISNSLTTKEGSRATDNFILQNKYSENRIFRISPTITSTESKTTYLVHSLFPRTGNPKQGGTGHLYKDDGTSYCLDTGNCLTQLLDNFQFRRLTPKECFRLMGFLNDEIDLTGLSDNQLYKLVGNGWEINLVSKIFKEMFK